jgi:transcriptional regulator with XRE-family HTH domain
VKPRSRKELMALAREAIQQSGLSKAQIARDAGLSRAALNAWIAGVRGPGADSLDRLAAGLDARADTLAQLAAQLRAAAKAKRAAGEE